ncbi:hypothetical protein RQP46_004622 [Phenoliferia psychrophenolica]
MLTKLFSPIAKLEVQIAHNVVFVYPSLLPNSGRSALPESALGGVVNVLLPMRRRVSSICVVAKGVLHRTPLDPLVTAVLEFSTGLLTSVSSPAVRIFVIPLRDEPGAVPDPFDFSYEQALSIGVSSILLPPQPCCRTLPNG